MAPKLWRKNTVVPDGATGIKPFNDIEHCDLRHRRHPSNEYSQVQHRSGIMELTMSLLHKTDVYQGANEKAVRKSREYGFVLALIVMALALVVAKYSRQHPLMVTGSVLNSADVDMRTSEGMTNEK